jgi:DNA-binding beta-propeller fold protein YncE
MSSSRFRFIPTVGAAALAIAVPASLAGQTNPAVERNAGAAVAPINHLPNPYSMIPAWGVLPNGRSWGSVSAVHVDVDGRHIWAGDRCGANSCANSNVDPIVKLDPEGRVVASFGAGLIVWPHGIHVDRQGNVWVVDSRAANARELEANPAAAGKGHTVLKFSPAGQLLMTIGTGGVAGDPPRALSEPTDIVTAPNGDIFIAEAHNAQFINEPTAGAVGRISKYSADGTFIKSFGQWGFERGEFRGPHALAMDSQGRLFVADRGNNRIQIFDQDGNFLDQWFQFSRISGLFIDANDTLYAIDSESDPNYNPGWRKGIRVGSARTGEVWYYIPEHNSERPSGMGGFGSAGEGITVDAAGNIYTGEVGPVTGMTKYVPALLPGR